MNFNLLIVVVIEVTNMAVYTEDVKDKIKDWFAGCISLSDIRELYNAIRTEADIQHDMITEEIVKRDLRMTLP